jgi:hypothetical protein
MVTTLILEKYLVAVIVGMLLVMETGRRLALRHPPPAASTGTSTVVGCCFGLMSLLIAFTFYGAGARFDLRRDLIVQEANAVSTAYDRLDLLPKEDQPRVKEMFRQYVRSRLETYQKIEEAEGFKAALARTSALQNEIWQAVVAAGPATGTTIAHIVLLPSVNQMFDIATTRTVALEAHPPETVIGLLVLTVMVSSLLAGYELSGRGPYNWLYRASYIIVLSAALVVTTDYEYPRLGIAKISLYDKVIQQTLDNMK